MVVKVNWFFYRGDYYDRLECTLFDAWCRFISQGGERGLVGNEGLQVPVNAGENLYHQIQDNDLLIMSFHLLSIFYLQFDEWE